LKRKKQGNGLIDLIFKDRNQDYGAYAIIKSSLRRVRISFLIAIAIFLLLVLIIGGVIRIPWITYYDENQSFNVVSVKYDPSLITVISEPFKVVPKQEKKKVFTNPTIEDEQKEVAPIEGSKSKDEKSHSEDKSEEARKDSLKAVEKESNEKNTQEGKSPADSMVVVDQLPQFPGGANALRLFISKNLKYPADAINRKIQGTVVMSFVVEKDGTVRRIIITKAVDPVLDFEAVRVISTMPRWQPASVHGRPIATMIVMPVIFTLRP